MNATRHASPSTRLAAALTCARLAEALASLHATRGDAALAKRWRDQADAERIRVALAACEA